MQKITLGQQESLAALARRHGFLGKTIWEHADNATLRERRTNPNILNAGDVVTIPDRVERTERCATEKTHVFKKLGDKIELRLVLKAFGEPRKNEPYALIVGAKTTEGQTDGSGLLRAFVPADAGSATLLLDEGKTRMVLRISRLDPVETTTGVQQRLNNLGYPCGTETDELTPRARRALRSFQADQEIAETGEIDAATVSALTAAYGS